MPHAEDNNMSQTKIMTNGDSVTSSKFLDASSTPSKLSNYH